jgi:hypothetical protein
MLGLGFTAGAGFPVVEEGRDRGISCLVGDFVGDYSLLAGSSIDEQWADEHTLRFRVVGSLGAGEGLESMLCRFAVAEATLPVFLNGAAPDT